MVNRIFRIVIILLFGIFSNYQEAFCTSFENRAASKIIDDLYELIEQNYNNSLEGKAHLNQYMLYVNPLDLSSAMCTDPYIMDNAPSWNIAEIWDDLNGELCAFNTNNVFDFSHYGIVVWYPENNEDSELYDLMDAFVQQQDGETIAPYMGNQANGGLKKSFKPILDEIQNHVNNNFQCPTPVSGELIITIAGYQPFRNYEQELQYKTQTKTISVTSQLMTEHFENYIEFVDSPNNPHYNTTINSFYYGKLYKRLAGYVYYFQNINNLPSGTTCADLPSFSTARGNNMVACYCTQFPNMTQEQIQLLYVYGQLIDFDPVYFSQQGAWNSPNDCVGAESNNWFYGFFPDFVANGGTDDWKTYLLNQIISTSNYPDIGVLLYLKGTSVADHIALSPGQCMALLNAIANYDPQTTTNWVGLSYVITEVSIAPLKLMLHEFLNTMLTRSNSDVIAFKNILNINTGFLNWLWDDVLDTILGNEAQKESIVTAITQIALKDFAGAPSGEAYSQAFGDKSFIWKLNPKFGYEVDHHTYENAAYDAVNNKVTFDHKYVVSKTTTTTFNPYDTQGDGLNTHTNIQFDNQFANLSPFDIVCVVPGKNIKWNTDCWSLLSGTACDFSAKFMPAYVLAWYIANNQGTTTFEQFSTAAQVVTFAVGAVVFVTAAAPAAAIVAGFVLVADAAALVAAPAYQYAAFDPDGEADPNEISAMAAEIQGIADMASLAAGITELGLGGLKGFQAYFRLRSLGNGAESVEDFNKALVALRNLADTDPSDMAKVCDHLGIVGSARTFITELDKPGEIKLVLAGWLKSKPDLMAAVNASQSTNKLNFLVKSLENNAIQREIIRIGHTNFLKFINDFDDFTEFIGNPNMMKTWKVFNLEGKNFARLNKVAIARYTEMAEHIKPLIIKFSDNSASNSSLLKFLNDCENAEFNSFVNNLDNEAKVKSFLSHKDIDMSDITDEIADQVIDDIDDLKDFVGERARYWNKRSSIIANNNSKFAKARAFETSNSTKVANNTNPPCGAWGGNGNGIQHAQLHCKDLGTGKRVILDDAIVDPISVATTPAGDPIYKLIYHDSKLTNLAPWSKNQKSEIIDVFMNNSNLDYIDFEVRNVSSYFDDIPNSPLDTEVTIRIYRGDIYKSISNGDGVNITETIKIFN